MKILYISQNFHPEMGAAAARVYELSKYWVNLGHSVTVLTGFPNYPDGKIYEEYQTRKNKLFAREEIQGIKVIRVPIFPTHLRSPVRRALNYISFFTSSLVSSLFLKNRDVVIATSPSLFTGLTGLFFSRLKDVPFVFEVRDLWPEVIPAMGIGDSSSMSYRAFDRIASLLYRRSNLIVTVTESFKDEIVTARGIPPQKIKIIENAVDTDFFKPFRAEPILTDTPELRNKFIVSYIGTIDYTHGVEVVLKAATDAALQFPDLVFLLIGDGSDKERLEKINREEKLGNVVFLKHQPRKTIPGYINASDISLVLSSRESLLEKTMFAKVFEPLACGKPIIVGAKGETRNLVVEKANAGIGFEPESASGLIDAIGELYNNPELRNQLGENGRSYVTRAFSRESKAEQYSEMLEELTGKK